MKEREEILSFSVISAITGEFTPEFLEWWPFKGVPMLCNYQEPYQKHLLSVIGLKYIFRPEVGSWVVPITAYCGLWRAQIMQVSKYRSWVNSSAKNLDKASQL